jgi:RimJ/RimL family protein N-acetyltransferase
MDAILLREHVKGDEKELLKIIGESTFHYGNVVSKRDLAKTLMAKRGKNAGAFAVIHMDGVGKVVVGQAEYAMQRGRHAIVAEVAVWIGEKYYGKGYGQRAFVALFQEVWRREPGCVRIEGGVFSGNIRSMSCLIKLGIVPEYVRRNCIVDRHGRLHDEVMFSVFRDDQRYGDGK